jgi:hypothetical protein
LCCTQGLGINHISQYYWDFIKALEGGSTNFKPLKILHHFSSGLKSYVTTTIYNTATNMREACGGAGFLEFSGLPYVVKEYSANVAFEGDNTVMAQ